MLKNRTLLEIEQAVVALAIDQPAWGQVRHGRGTCLNTHPQSQLIVDRRPSQGCSYLAKMIH